MNKFKRSFLRSACPALLLSNVGLSVFGQIQGSSSIKSTPGVILPKILVLQEEVVQDHWTHTLKLVNVSTSLKQVEPGQCVRFGVVATGDGRDQLLESASYQFQFSAFGKTQTFAMSSAYVVKQVKPEGGDFVMLALAAGGIKNPAISMASMAASEARWCVPIDARDGTSSVRATIKLADGKTISLAPRPLEIRTFLTARKQAAFTNFESLGLWLQQYHNAPDPAQILPALRLVAADEKGRAMLNVMAFFIAALKANREAAEEVKAKLPFESAGTIAYATPLLRSAEFSQQGSKIETAGGARAIPDSYDLTPDRNLFTKLDMLWATYFATGDFKPVNALVSMLAWREDEDKLQKVRKSGQKPLELTDSIVKAVVFEAAGWSLGSIAKNDGLVADYLDALKISESTPQAVKAEIANLYTDPAFDRRR